MYLSLMHKVTRRKEISLLQGRFVHGALMKRRQLPARLICLTLITGFALSACGIRGDLKTPPPLWGEDIRSDSQKADVERAKADRLKRAEEKTERDAKKAAQASEASK